MAPNPMLVRAVTTLLPRFAYRFSCEVELHKGIAQVLDGAGITYAREHVAGPQDRFDFLLDSGIVIEAKTQGSLANALIQCSRYLQREDVSAVVLVATRRWASYELDKALQEGEKRIHIVRLKGAAF